MLVLLLLIHHTLNTTCLILKSSVMIFFHVFCVLNPWKAYGPNGISPIVLKNCFSVHAPCLVRRFVFAYEFPPFPLPGSMLTYNLFLRRMTAPIPQTTVLLLWFPAFLKVLSLSLTEGFRGIYPLTTFYLSQYGFRSERSTGDRLAFFTNSWSSSFWGDFSAMFSVALDISKAFDSLAQRFYS